jgi:hypothetical protein
MQTGREWAQGLDNYGAGPHSLFPRDSSRQESGNRTAPPTNREPQESESGPYPAAAAAGTETIDADIWFNDWERGGVLLEEARHFPRWDQTLTMLWFEDEEVPPPKREGEELREDEEELGLEELDGNLRWPSKKRRR